MLRPRLRWHECVRRVTFRSSLSRLIMFFLARATPLGSRATPLIPSVSMAAPNRTERSQSQRLVDAMPCCAPLVSAHGNNFIKTMLRLGTERDVLTIVADQIGGPTGGGEIAQACVTIAKTLLTESHKSGIYRFSSAPDTSWADFARAIFDQAGLTCAVTDIPSSDYPTPAKRPLNSRMDCSAKTATFGILRPEWRTSLTHILTQLDIPKD